jgi:large repetitive protein
MALTVTVGGTPATNVTVVSDTEVTATTPAGTAGTADVVVTTSGGTDTLDDAFTYET